MRKTAESSVDGRDSNRMELIVAGLGGNSRRWLPTIAQGDHWRVAAGVDPDPEARRRAVAEYGLAPTALFEGLDAALEAAPAAAVLVATPAGAHAGPVSAALRAHRHVLSEKPMATDLEQALGLVRLARSAGTIYMVNQNYRFCRFARSLRKALGEGAIGAPAFVELTFHRNWAPTGYRKSLPHVIVFEMAVHHFDLLRFVFRSEVASVLAVRPSLRWSEYDGAPAVQALVTLQNGVTVAYTASRQTRGLSTPYEGLWRIVGSEGSLHLADLGRGVGIYLDREGDRAELLELSDGIEPGFGECLKKFAEAIRSGQEPETAPNDNIKTLAACFAAVRAYETGGPVSPLDLIADVLAPRKARAGSS